jgi:four helix bundle suffix protein
MNADSEGPFLPHGGYRRQRSYKVAEAVYDGTVVFCRRFLAHDRRLTDQMNQAAYLLRRQLESQGRAFLEKGGFTESLYAARSQARNALEPRLQPAAAPTCPKCGRPMLRLTAKAGAHAGEAFYGCSDYPKCKGIRPITQTGQTGPTGQTNT